MAVCAEPGCPELVPDKGYCKAHTRPRISPSSKATRNARYRKTRTYVLRRDRYRCHYCGKPADQADHVVPVSKGGADTHTNLVACCARCNMRKGNRTHA